MDREETKEQSAPELKKFDSSNVVESIDDAQIYAETDQGLKDKSPWLHDKSYFDKAKISLVSLIKMLIHSGMANDYEVMGYCRGRFTPQTVWIIDSFDIPAQATFTSVLHTPACDQFVYKEIENNDLLERKENIVAWYHSHPSYHPFLSGQDVTTQRQQQYLNNFSAVVIDPISSKGMGKVDIGVFRTWPSKEMNGGKEYEKTPKDLKRALVQTGVIDEEKIKECGIHANEYYALEVSFFKNSMDTELIQQLWNKYWINTVTQGPLYQQNDYFVNKLKLLATKSQGFKKQKQDKVVKAEDLIGENQKQQYNPFLASSLEKNQAIISESVKNLLFSYKL